MPLDNWTSEDYETDRQARRAIANQLGFMCDRLAWTLAVVAFVALTVVSCLIVTLL